MCMISIGTTRHNLPMFWFIQLFLLLLWPAVYGNKAIQRQLQFLNKSGSKVEVYWIHPQTGSLSLVSHPNVLNGATLHQETYIGHAFQIREVPSEGICRRQEESCRTAYLHVSEHYGQFAELNGFFDVLFQDDLIQSQREAQELVWSCRNMVMKSWTDQSILLSMQEVNGILNSVLSCVETDMAKSIFQLKEELAFQANVRSDMAKQMEDYTCADTSLETSTPLKVSVWEGAKDKAARTEHILLDRPASKIHLIKDFISDDECLAIETAAKPRMEQAMTADGKGGSHYSEHRKAMVGAVPIPWRLEEKGNLIANVARRIYDYTDHVLHLGIREFGQESLISIQYFGRGINDTTTPDQYKPHCDSDCSGMRHRQGNRVATMVLYCTVPKLGGHTNFRNTGVHIKPETGSGLFFSYIDTDTHVMDSGFTEHSGCPVYEGQKKIVTQWIRLGVDDQHPWDSLNTLGVKKDEETKD